MSARLKRILGVSTALALMASGVALAASDPPPPRPRPAVANIAGAREASLPTAQAAPLPRPRPATAPPQETLAWAGAAEEHFRDAGSRPSAVAEPTEMSNANAIDAIDAVAPLPRPRPASEATELALLAPRSLQEAPVTIEPADTACLARLRTLGVAFSEEPAIDPGGPCNVDHPLDVTALGDGIAIEPEAILNCRTAEALARWVQDVVMPSAGAAFGESPTTIVHGSTYVCRPRNNVAGGKLSEHAHANAVDISSFRFAARVPAEIGGDGDKEARDFEAAIRSAACRYFITVLGPGSNAAHATHLHLDLAERRGGYRLCELDAPAIARVP